MTVLLIAAAVACVLLMRAVPRRERQHDAVVDPAERNRLDHLNRIVDRP
jgi:hypothetical protein